MKLFLFGLSLALALPIVPNASHPNQLTYHAIVLEPNASHNLSEQVASYNLSRDAFVSTSNNLTDHILELVRKATVGENMSEHNGSRKLLNATAARTTGFRNLTGRSNITLDDSFSLKARRNILALNAFRDADSRNAALNVTNKSAKKTVSLLKDYTDLPNETKHSWVFNNTEKFWGDVKKWANSTTGECKELIQTWFDSYSTIIARGLPTSFSTVGNDSAICKIIKEIMIPKSVIWSTDFFNDLTSSAMGSLWVSGEAVDKSIHLPDDLEFVYYIQFDTNTKKLVELEIVPMEPDVIYEAVASRPVKSFHHLLRVALKEGFKSPEFQNLLSDKFVLQAPNIFLGHRDFKTQFSKVEMQEFLDQDVKIFDLDEAQISEFSVPFHDEKSVVSEIRFDSLPIKVNGLELEGIKFWLTHTFDCDENSTNDHELNITNSSRVVGNATVPQVNQVDVKPQTMDQEPFCLLSKLQVIVNRPLSLLARFKLMDLDLDRNASHTNKTEQKNGSK